MEKSESKPKQPMSDEERLKFAQKLDADLDDYISKLPRKKYEDGWPEDRWEEEMDRHPFFMKQAPKPGDELHPLYEGLQKLKYDPDENEPLELAISYKEDGNFNFKHKNYRLAIVAYTEGIKQKCGDVDLDASLLNNRSASHWFLKNYRSSLKDCQLALKLNPTHLKALNRAAQCSYHMAQFNQAIQYCDKLLEINRDDKEVLELRKKCVNDLKLQERNARKRELADKRRQQLEDILKKRILESGYQIDGGNDGNINVSELEPCFPQLAETPVHYSEETNSLIWPVVLVYPEYRQMDYIQEFNEQEYFFDHLKLVFETYPEWDEQRKYRPENINVYFENPQKKWIKIDPSQRLEDILKTPGYVIRGGTPSFIVLVKESAAEKVLLESQY